jgi:hypothetical protein
MNTIEDVRDWILSRQKEGAYRGAGARIRRTAIEQLADVLSTEESRDPEWMLHNIEQISQRWAEKHPQANPATASTYRSRARATLREFLDSTKDPARHSANTSPSTSPPNTDLRATKNKPPAAAPSLPMPATAETQSFSFALSCGRRAHVAVPTNLTKLDIKLIKKQIELLELQVESSHLARKEGK